MMLQYRATAVQPFCSAILANEVIDKIENLCNERALTAFGLDEKRPAVLWQPSKLCRVHGSADTSFARHGPRLTRWWAPDPRLLHSEEEDLRYIPLLRVSPVQCAPRDGHHRI